MSVRDRSVGQQQVFVFVFKHMEIFEAKGEDIPSYHNPPVRTLRWRLCAG